jgi:hypothetical protein
MGIIFSSFLLDRKLALEEKNRSNSEINASPDGINDLNFINIC